MKKLTLAQRKNMAQAAVRISKRTREPLSEEIYILAGEEVPDTQKKGRKKLAAS